jgi:hypothetical protein
MEEINTLTTSLSSLNITKNTKKKTTQTKKKQCSKKETVDTLIKKVKTMSIKNEKPTKKKEQELVSYLHKKMPKTTEEYSIKLEYTKTLLKNSYNNEKKKKEKKEIKIIPFIC